MSAAPTGPLPDAVVSAFLARYRAERIAAGLPEKITDPTVLDRIAAIVATNYRTPHND